MKTAVLSIAIAAGVAQAGTATITQMDSFSGTPDFERVSTFDKFDASLGTLTGVEISLMLTIDGGFLAVDNDGIGPAIADVEFGASGELSSTDVTLFPVPSVTTSNMTTFNLDADDGDGSGVQNTGGDFGVLNGVLTVNSSTTNINPVFFGDYIGAGDTFDTLADIDQIIDFGGVSGIAGEFGPQTADLKVTVVYTYIPIPAPGAMALLGLGGLVAARRRR